MVPYDDKSPFITSGIRLGTPAITTRGLKETDMETIASLVDKVVMNPNDKQNLLSVKKSVNDLMSNRPLFVV